MIRSTLHQTRRLSQVCSGGDVFGIMSHDKYDFSGHSLRPLQCDASGR